LSAPLDVLAIGAHPDDAELGCGGTLALLARAGKRVGLLHLTGGEAGTRGSAGERRREAERSAEILGAVELAFLDCGDGALRRGEAEEDALIAELRRLRPELLFAPAPDDRHPDHGRAHRLVVDAAFYAGLRRRGSGTPHRPGGVFAYMQHDPFQPSFVVDVTSVWDVKERALDAYETQIHRPGATTGSPGGAATGEGAATAAAMASAAALAGSGTAAGPEVAGAGDGAATFAAAPAPTKVSSPEFRLAVAGRAQHYGLLVGAAYGEPFWSKLPLAVRDPLQVLPGGTR
jgi:bacillithiol biosynthesis deacetylase BshB1